MAQHTLAVRGVPARSAARWWILAFIAGAQLMVVLDTTIMLIALPSAQHALGFSVTSRQWVITAYTITFGGLLLLGGRLSDQLGSKRAMTIGVARTRRSPWPCSLTTGRSCSSPTSCRASSTCPRWPPGSASCP